MLYNILSPFFCYDLITDAKNICHLPSSLEKCIYILQLDK